MGPDARNVEFAQGKGVVDVAVAEGVQYMIFSTLPHVSKISGGKYTKVVAFDAKAEIEDYIRRVLSEAPSFHLPFSCRTFKGLWKCSPPSQEPL
jgi:hypothetical protein